MRDIKIGQRWIFDNNLIIEIVKLPNIGIVLYIKYSNSFYSFGEEIISTVDLEDNHYWKPLLGQDNPK